ncbi:MAG: putative zinc-binding protein [Proteobacteria bacterium]|nr:putative zinc-binding protein [Pseudomonadota bacterium]
MLLACSGASNVGQLTNQAAVELTREGLGRMFCLAGIGGGLSGFVQSARDAATLVVMDGCELGCARAIFERAEVPLKNYLVVTDLGIDKNHDLALDRQSLETLKMAVRRAAGWRPPRLARPGGGSCGCGG